MIYSCEEKPCPGHLFVMSLSLTAVAGQKACENTGRRGRGALASTMIYRAVCFSVQEDENKDDRNKSNESAYSLVLQ